MVQRTIVHTQETGVGLALVWWWSSRIWDIKEAINQNRTRWNNVVDSRTNAVIVRYECLRFMCGSWKKTLIWLVLTSLELMWRRWSAETSKWWMNTAWSTCPLDNLYCAWFNEHASRRSEVNWRAKRSGLGTEGRDLAHWPSSCIWNDEDADSHWGRGKFLSRYINIQVKAGFICLCLWRGLRNRILGICGSDIRGVYDWPWVSPNGGPNRLKFTKFAILFCILWNREKEELS